MDTLTIKEISRKKLGLWCKGDYSICNKGCFDTLVRCNGEEIEVIYDIDGELIKTIEHAQFSRKLKEEIKVIVHDKECFMDILDEDGELRYAVQFSFNFNELVDKFED